MISKLPNSTAIHPSTSSNRCKQIAFSFIVLPFVNLKTAAPFTITPKTAMISIPWSLTSLGLKICGAALERIMTDPIKRIAAFTMAPINENRL